MPAPYPILDFGPDDLPDDLRNEVPLPAAGVDLGAKALTPRVAYVLTRIDGMTSLGDLVRMLPLPTRELFETILLLHIEGLVTFSPEIEERYLRPRSITPPRRTAVSGVPLRPPTGAPGVAGAPAAPGTTPPDSRVAGAQATRPPTAPPGTAMRPPTAPPGTASPASSASGPPAVSRAAILPPSADSAPSPPAEAEETRRSSPSLPRMSVPTVQPARISGLPPAPGPGVPASELDAAVRRPATFSIAPPAPGEKAAARPSRTPSLPPMPLAVETSGSLGVRSPAKLALELKAARCSGVLVMRKEKVEKRIWFAAGTPVQIESTSPEEDLGALMKKRGKLDDDVFAAYQALRREGRSAVDALVEIGAVQAADAPKADRWRAQGVLYDALLWRDGTYEFQPAAELPATVPRYDMALPVLMVKAWREAPFDDSRKKFLDAHRNWYVVPGAISDDTAAKMRLNPKEERLLDAVKGQARRIRDIFEMSSLLLTDTYRFIDGLLAMGMAELSERNPMETGPVDVKELRGLLETMEAQNLFDRLSAHPVSTDQDIEDAWKRARSLYEPSRYRNLRPETKATLERILKLSSEAYEHLKDGKRRKSYRFQQYDRQRLDYFAEIQFRKGEIYLFWRDDPKTAFEMFESSWEMCPDNPLYVVSYALSAMRAYPGEARRRAEAKGLIERALSRVDVPPKVMVIAAAVYRLLGEMPRSEQLCRAALQASGGATDIVQMVEQVRKQ